MSAKNEPNNINVSLRISESLDNQVERCAEKIGKKKAEVLRLAMEIGIGDLLLISHNEAEEIRRKIDEARFKTLTSERK